MNVGRVNECEYAENKADGHLAIVRQIYSVIISVNLSCDTYEVVEGDELMATGYRLQGAYDEFIGEVCNNIHSSYKEVFLEKFRRENLLNLSSEGVTTQVMECPITDNDEEKWIHIQGVCTEYAKDRKIQWYIFVRNMHKSPGADDIHSIEKRNQELEYLRSKQTGGYHRCLRDKEFPFLEISPRFEQITGYTADEIKKDYNNRLINLVHPEDVHILHEELYNHLEDENGVAHLRYRLKTRNRGYIWIKSTSRLCKYRGRDFYQTSIAEITQEMERQFELQRKNSQLEVMLKAIAGGMVISNTEAEYSFRYVSEEAARLFGYSVEEFLRMCNGKATMIIHPEDVDCVIEEINRQLNEEGRDFYQVQYRVKCKDGSYKHIIDCGKPGTDEDDNKCMHSYFVDITREKESQSIIELQKQNIMQMEVIQTLSKDYQNVYFVDLENDTYEIYRTRGVTLDFGQRHGVEEMKFSEYVIKYANEQMYQYDREAFINAISKKEIVAKLKNRESFVYNYRLINNGKVEYYQTKFVRLGDNPEKYILGTLNVDDETQKDIEQRSLLTDALAQAEYANRAKTVFLNNMSHDIRTPMNAIIGYATLASAHLDNRDRVEDYLKKITQSSNHLLSLINDILDMSRIESGNMQFEEKPERITDILSGIRNIVDSEVQAKQQSLYIDTTNIPDEEIMCDKLRMNQILINLISNAIKFTPAGGTISVKAGCISSVPKGYVTYEFKVKDTGIGIGKEFLHQIFDPFARERNSTISGIQGTGLGMAITKNLVDLQGGKIDVYSEVGKGTEFVVTMQFRLYSEFRRQDNANNFEDKRVLVVGSNMGACLDMSKMLGQMGLRNEWTMYAGDALNKVQQAMENNDRYGLYIVDWLMPDMNGIDITRSIRNMAGREVPIIVVSSYDWKEIRDKAIEAGATKFICGQLTASDVKYVLLGNEENSNKSSGNVELEKSYTGKRVLLAEDNEMNQEISCEILKELGADVDVASNGKEVIEMLTNKPAGYYDLIFMDIQMPVMDGYDATRNIRNLQDKAKASIPILAMTANAFYEDKVLAKDAGMDGHIAKPIELPKLIKALDKYLLGK